MEEYKWTVIGNSLNNPKEDQVLDVETGKIVEKSRCTVIVDSYSIIDDNFVAQNVFYSSKPQKYPHIYIGKNRPIPFSHRLIEDENIIEDLKWGLFYHSLFASYYPDFAENFYRGSKKYRTYENVYPKEQEKTNNFLLTGNKKYTFGVELETASGYIPEYLDYILDMFCEYDGSLRPEGGGDPVSGEYVTGVLTGNNGLLHLQKICNELSKRCTVDKKCG